jgi:hypothetical protein
MRYLKTVIMPEEKEDIDPIIDGLRTTIDREPIIDEEGDAYIEILSDEELMLEAFCLGCCYERLTAEGFDDPFMIEIVELDEPPKDMEDTPSISL